LLLAFKEGERQAEQGHTLEVTKKAGVVQANEFKEVSDYLTQPANWKAARILAVEDGTVGATETRFELIVPKLAATENHPPLTLSLWWRKARTASDEQKVATTLKDESATLNGSLRDGIHRLIDRLRALRFQQNAITEVKVYFSRQLYDAVITMDLRRSSEPSRTRLAELQ
jgi:hypothetical protein